MNNDAKISGKLDIPIRIAFFNPISTKNYGLVKYIHEITTCNSKDEKTNWDSYLEKREMCGLTLAGGSNSTGLHGVCEEAMLGSKWICLAQYWECFPLNIYIYH